MRRVVVTAAWCVGLAVLVVAMGCSTGPRNLTVSQLAAEKRPMARVQVSGVIEGRPASSAGGTTLVLGDNDEGSAKVKVYLSASELDTPLSGEELDGRSMIVTGAWDGSLLNGEYYIIKDMNR